MIKRYDIRPRRKKGTGEPEASEDLGRRWSDQKFTSPCTNSRRSVGIAGVTFAVENPS